MTIEKSLLWYISKPTPWWTIDHHYEGNGYNDDDDDDADDDAGDADDYEDDDDDGDDDDIEGIIYKGGASGSGQEWAGLGNAVQSRGL